MLLFFNSNVLELIDFLEAFKIYNRKSNKIKFLHVSTDEVYGDIIKGRAKETWKYKPSSPYAASKASSDHIISSYVRTFKIPCVNIGRRQNKRLRAKNVIDVEHDVKKIKEAIIFL